MIRLGLTDIDRAWNYSASTTEYTDETTDINSTGAGDVNVFSSTCVNIGDAFYFGHSYNRFARISGSVSSVAAACPTTVYEYYNSGASNWVQIPSSDLDAVFDWKTAGSQDLLISPSAYDLLRESWEKTSVCNVSAYYLRARCSTVSSGGSGATLTSASVDISLPSPVPMLEIQKIGRLHTALDGTRTFDQNAEKRRWRFTWASLKKDDVVSLRERVAMTKATCVVFPNGWNEDSDFSIVIMDPEAPYSDSYISPALHNVIVHFLEE